jgi:DNA-binding NtrC family response regulator
MNASRILIIDDDEVARRNLCRLLERDGHRTCAVKDGPSGLARLEREPYDLVLTDLVMEGMTGLEVVREVKSRLPDSEVIVVTAFASVESAIEAIKGGAYHYLRKPYRPDEVRQLVARALETIGLRRQVRELMARGEGPSPAPAFIGASRAVTTMIETIRQVAPTDCNVLVAGESGTGKELVAALIHHHSRRREGKFLAINCGALTEDLLANELFGHVEGAYTGATRSRPGLLESAAGGTVLLDEVGDMSPAMQVKLLRAIQEQEVIPVGSTRPVPLDVRIIAATNKNLKKAVAAGLFREDLYYRLKVIALDIPPLRDRRDDIPLLAHYFLRRAAERSRKTVTGFSDEAMEALCRYSYPGNVRELENVIERAVALAREETIHLHDLPHDLRELEVFSFAEDGSHLRSLKEVEREYIQWVLRRVGRNRTRAARVLGIDRATLWRHLKAQEIEPGDD